MRRPRVEVVSRPVEIYGQQEDAVEAVLRPVGLRLDEQHLLGQAIGRVRLFRIAVPEIVLMKRDRRELGVGADRAHADEFLDAGKPRLLHQLGAHHEVVEEEATRVGAVGADAADYCREVNDHIRLGICQCFAAGRVKSVDERPAIHAAGRYFDVCDDLPFR